MRLCLLQVSSDPHRSLGIVIQEPDSCIALAAEQAAYFPGPVTVVYVKATLSRAGPIRRALADSAYAVLSLKKSAIVVKGQGITLLKLHNPASFLFLVGERSLAAIPPRLLWIRRTPRTHAIGVISLSAISASIRKTPTVLGRERLPTIDTRARNYPHHQDHKPVTAPNAFGR
jgi:hypothetical protein